MKSETLAENEFIQAIWIADRLIRPDWSGRIILWATIVIASIGVAALITGLRGILSTLDVAALSVKICASIFCFYFLVRMLRRKYTTWLLRNSFRNDSILGEPFTYSWDETNLTIKAKSSTLCLPWKGFTSWLERNDYFLLLMPHHKFTIVLKRCFENDQEKNDFLSHLHHTYREPNNG